MTCLATSCHWSASLRSAAGGLLLVLGLAACAGEGDGVGPTSESTTPTDSTLAPGDTTIAAPTDSTVPTPPDSTLPPADSTLTPPDSTPPPADSTLPPADSSLGGGAAAPDPGATSPHQGLVFGSFNMKHGVYSAVHTGAVRQLEPTWLMGELVGVRAKGGRVIIKLVGGPDDFVQNSDRTFSLTKWKALVDRFRDMDFGSYIEDGTILGHYLIDEPYHARKWGGKMIPASTVEEMARYSKAIWPNMTTFVRAHPTWLEETPITYKYLDAGWSQYEPYMGEVNQWIAAEVAAAKRLGLGMAVGLNVLNGGDGSSGIKGTRAGKYVMSANELRRLGGVVLNQTYSCAFFMWMYQKPYHDRADIQSAMAELSSKAKSHVKTSCRQ